MEELTEDRATEIYNSELRESECKEYLEAASIVDRQISIEVWGNEDKHDAHGLMLAALLVDEVIFLNDNWWEKDWPEKARETVALCVNCNDVFAWACADAERIFRKDIPDLFDHWRHDKSWGAAVWCMKKRRQMPQKPLEAILRKEGRWDLDALNLAFQDGTETLSKMYAAVVTDAALDNAS